MDDVGLQVNGMTEIPKPKEYGSFDVEPFEDYRARLPSEFDAVPDAVLETWIYRHWSDFQEWLPLRPLEWKYKLVSMPSAEITRIDHVGQWSDTLRYWGDDLLDGRRFFAFSPPFAKFIGMHKSLCNKDFSLRLHSLQCSNIHRNSPPT